LFVSNYARATHIIGNEFVWCGDSAVLIVGKTQLIDGTSGNNPIGLYDTQTSKKKKKRVPVNPTISI